MGPASVFVLVLTLRDVYIASAGWQAPADQPGTLILATYVSDYDGPLVSAILYSTARVRPTVHYDEYSQPSSVPDVCRRRDPDVNAGNHGLKINAPRAKTTLGSSIRC
jgi:hypothetical protein